MTVVNETDQQAADGAREHPLRKLQVKPAPPTIDWRLQLHWGLAVLGKDRSQEYLAWWQAKQRQTMP